MKKIMMLVAYVAIVFGVSANERPIRFDQLPQKAQSFISEYFGTHKISYAKYDNDITDQNYDVIFTDGTKIEFGRRGEWRQIECKRGTVVPEGVLIPSIVSYIRHNHPDVAIVEADRHRHGWEIGLSNGIELKFSSQGHLKWYD